MLNYDLLRQDIDTIISECSCINTLINTYVSIYTDFGLSTDIKHVNKFYTSLSVLSKKSLKKQKDIINSIHKFLNHQIANKNVFTTYINKQKSTPHSMEDIETLLHQVDFEQCTDLVKISDIKEGLSPNAIRLVYHLLKCKSKSVAVRLLYYLVGETRLKVREVCLQRICDRLKISVTLKRDIVWYIWLALIHTSHGAFLDLVLLNFKIFCLGYSKETRYMRIPILAYLLMICNSSDIGKYVKEYDNNNTMTSISLSYSDNKKTSTIINGGSGATDFDDAVDEDDTIDYLHVLTYKNPLLINEVKREVISITEDLELSNEEKANGGGSKSLHCSVVDGRL